MRLTLSHSLVILSFIFIAACSAPMSKESYLKKYEAFIKEVSNKNKDYDEKAWKNADEKYEKFQGEWYDKFKDEFTWQEQLEITKFSVEYNLYKAKDSSISLFNTYLKGDYEKLKEKIKYYKDNNMEEDIDKLLKEAKELGDTSLVVVQDILKELENSQK